MGQKGQRSDTHTLTHEAQTLTRDVVTAPFRLRTYRLIRKILIGFILVSIANVLFSYFFYTPRCTAHPRDRDLVIKYASCRTASARRSATWTKYATATTTSTVALLDRHDVDRRRWQPYPDTKYAALLDDDYAPLMVGTWRQLDALARTLYLESVSFDELQAFSQDKEKMSAAVPASGPSTVRRCTTTTSAHSRRAATYPVLHRVQAHTGVDSAATGVRRYTPWRRRGGTGRRQRLQRRLRLSGARKPRFRLQDRYAHLSKVLVKRANA